MTAKLINYTSKYIRDSITQLENFEKVYAISFKMKKDIEQAIISAKLNVERESYAGYWSYVKKEDKV